MSAPRGYLTRKRRARLVQREALEDAASGAVEQAQDVFAEGCGGVRRIRIRDHQIISDSEFSFAGYDLSSTSPELQLCVLGSWLTHIPLIQAAAREIRLDSVEVEVIARIDPCAGRPGFDEVPANPNDISYLVRLRSPADSRARRELYDAVERARTVLNLVRHPQRIKGEFLRVEDWLHHDR